jgi:hypothetical protein
MNPLLTRFWLRALGGLLAGLAVGLVLLVVGGHWWLNRYLHSDGFRKLVGQKTAAALRAEGEYLPLHWTGMTAYSDGFHARGLPGTALKELRADQIRAELAVTGLFRREWRISGLEIQRLEVALGPSIAEGARGARSLSAAADKPLQTGRQSRQVELEPIRIRDANIAWAMGGSASGSVRRAQMTWKIGDADGETSVSGGDLLLLDWQPMRIEQAQIRFQRESAFITGSQLRLADGGLLNVTGQLGLDASRESDLTLRFDEVPVDRWLPKDWRGRLTGRARGKSKVSGRLGDSNALSASGSIELIGGKLEALSVLDRLALFTGSEQFRRLELQKARADYTWTPSRLTVQRLFMESTGLLRIEGGCVVEKDIITGEFEVGVSAAILRWLPGARGRVFTVERDGYLWTKVKVQGSINDIREDLSTRLITAAGTEVYEETKGAVQKGAETLLDMFHKLTQ